MVGNRWCLLCVADNTDVVCCLLCVVCLCLLLCAVCCDLSVYVCGCVLCMVCCCELFVYAVPVVIYVLVLLPVLVLFFVCGCALSGDRCLMMVGRRWSLFVVVGLCMSVVRCCLLHDVCGLLLDVSCLMYDGGGWSLFVVVWRALCASFCPCCVVRWRLLVVWIMLFVVCCAAWCLLVIVWRCHAVRVACSFFLNLFCFCLFAWWFFVCALRAVRYLLFVVACICRPVFNVVRCSSSVAGVYCPLLLVRCSLCVACCCRVLYVVCRLLIVAV